MSCLESEIHPSSNLTSGQLQMYTGSKGAGSFVKLYVPRSTEFAFGGRGSHMRSMIRADCIAFRRTSQLESAGARSAVTGLFLLNLI